jgi:cytochrome c
MPNKMTLYAVIAAFWLAFLAILGVNLIGGMVMPHEEQVATTGYPIEVPEGDVAVASAAPEERPSALPLIAAATVEDGAKGFRKCQACHNLEPGGPNGTGPNLHNVVGRALAAVSNFGGYSDSLREVGGEWTYEKLDDYLQNPKRLAPKGNMAFIGLKKLPERAAVIKYLMANTENPPAVPEIAVEEPAMEGEDATEEPAEDAAE